jgi:hypothetical protein
MSTMRGIMHCLLRSCLEEDPENADQSQHEDTYEPPLAPSSVAALRHSYSDDEEYDDNDDDCCQPHPSNDNEQSSLHSLWRNLRNSLRTYDSLERVPRRPPQDQHDRDHDTAAVAALAALGPPPPPLMASFGGMFRRANSNSAAVGTSKPKSLEDDEHLLSSSKPTSSPLRTAVSFSEQSKTPVINPEEVVLPGSALQKLMAAHMAESMEGEIGDECVICMETFDATNPRMPTLCGCGENKTYFHLPCLFEWVEKKGAYCPSCRKRLRWEEF